MTRETARPLVLILVVAFLMVGQSVRAQALPEEVAQMSQRFAEEVGQIPVSDTYKASLARHALALFTSNQSGSRADSQYFLLADRNPEMQTVSLAFFDSRRGEVIILGSGKASTGNPKRVGHYETPIGVFQNTPSHMSWRALGTRNDKGWRGYGIKGSRVWDLGWQESKHPKGGPINIRPLVHATDPDAGEPKLGQRASKGCIRIPAKFNRFLDYYGILDAEYEKSPKGKHVLLRNREPVSLAGSYVVVIDSSSPEA